jgi:hypothetical protein
LTACGCDPTTPASPHVQVRRDTRLADDGGDRAAAIYSILGTASLNGLNPEGYLRHVLEHIPDHLINRIDELLPWYIAEKMPQLRIAA